jgi:AcrR family transcriptional regulator
MSEVDVKGLIVNAATIYFSKYGFHKTTMDEIAKHLHKAKGVLYYYFKSKEELFNEVLKQELDKVKTELKRIVDSDKDSLVVTKEFMLTRLKLLNSSAIYHETLKADFFEEYHFVKNVRDNFTDFERSQITQILQKGKTEGYINLKDIDSSVNVILMILSGIEIPLFLQNNFAEYESTIDEFASMIINGLKTQK